MVSFKQNKNAKSVNSKLPFDTNMKPFDKKQDVFNEITTNTVKFSLNVLRRLTKVTLDEICYSLKVPFGRKTPIVSTNLYIPDL